MSINTISESLPASGDRQKIRGLSIEGIVATYCVASICLQMFLPGLKYFSYGIPLLSLIALLASGKFSMPPNAPPYLVLIVAGVASAPLGTIKGLQDLWLMLMGLAPFCFGYRYKIGWRAIFIVTLLVTIATKGLSLAGGHFEFDILNSSSTFESSTSFVFGVLAAWAILEKRWGRVFIALLMAALTLKRIAVLAASVVLIVALLPRRPVDVLLRPVPMLILNAAFIFLTITYAQGGFDAWIQKTIGQSPNQFGVGRQQLYEAPVHLLALKPLQFAFYGVGAGGIYDIMKSSGNFNVSHVLHNDPLKILVEYGGLVWTCFFCIAYWSKSFSVRMMMLFTNILWLTDNTLIYPFVIMPTTLAIITLVSAEREKDRAIFNAETTERKPNSYSRFVVDNRA